MHKLTQSFKSKLIKKGKCDQKTKMKRIGCKIVLKIKQLPLLNTSVAAADVQHKKAINRPALHEVPCLLSQSCVRWNEWHVDGWLSMIQVSTLLLNGVNEVHCSLSFLAQFCMYSAQRPVPLNVYITEPVGYTNISSINHR